VHFINVHGELLVKFIYCSFKIGHFGCNIIVLLLSTNNIKPEPEWEDATIRKLCNLNMGLLKTNEEKFIEFKGTKIRIIWYRTELGMKAIQDG